MRRQITGYCNEDVSTGVGIAPYCELPDPSFQHLIGVETCVFA
jgi:hypothetical protein